MPVPWLAVGSLVLGNLDKIMSVVRPAFTRSKIEAVDSQADLLNQQIAELQTAAAANAEQIRALAAQLKDVVAAIEQAGLAAAAERAATRRLALAALLIGIGALLVGTIALLSLPDQPYGLDSVFGGGMPSAVVEETSGPYSLMVARRRSRLCLNTS